MLRHRYVSKRWKWSFYSSEDRMVSRLSTTSRSGSKGLKEAIIWLGNRGLTEVSIELDCKQVVDGISNNIGTNSELWAILNSCKAPLSFFPNFKISYVRWQANNVAHSLARASLSYASSHCHDHMTSCIKYNVMNKMN
jgi:ribonuclease HI